MKQQQIITDEDPVLNLNSVISLEESQDESRIKTIEKIKMIEDMLNKNSHDLPANSKLPISKDQLFQLRQSLMTNSEARE